MRFISQNECSIHMQKLKNKDDKNARKYKLKEEKFKYKRKKKNKPKSFSASKLILLGTILLCLEIIIFCEYAMIVLGDTNVLYALIGIPTTLVPVIVSYYNKSKAENTQGGVVFETAIHSKQNIEEEKKDDICVGDLDNIENSKNNEIGGKS